jgi:hypothetical protein
MTEQPDYSTMTPEETAAYLAEGSPDEQPLEHPDDSEAGINVDFNLDDEYKPTPLIPGGNYRGNVTAVAHEASKSAIAFKVTFNENGGVMSDGETKIDGATEYYRVWLPKPGDDLELESNGKVTKRQGKINRMKLFAKDLKIDMNTPAIIAQSIVEQKWIGIPVICALDIEEYQGVARNKISRMSRDTSRE